MVRGGLGGATLAVVALALLILIGYRWQATHPSGAERPPAEFVADSAELVHHESEARMNALLGALLRDADVELVAASVRTLAGAEIGAFTQQRFERWRIGGRTRANRGLLLLVAAAEQRVRLAVSYELESIYPDAFVAYVERAQMVPYFRDGLVAEGIEATVELIAGRAFEQIVGHAYDPATPGAATIGGYRAGGAGADTAVPLDATGPGPRPAAEGELRKVFGPQPTPAAAWQRFVELNRRRVNAPDLGIYDEAAQALLRRRPNTDAGQDHIVGLYAGRSYVVREQGDRAAVLFLDDPDYLLAPWFFRRTADGWRLDGSMFPGAIAYNHRNQWRFARRDNPYAFAFTDYVFDANGFARHQGSSPAR
jgi:uncharacterized protein